MLPRVPSRWHAACTEAPRFQGVKSSAMFRGSLLRLVLALVASLFLAGMSWAAHINTHPSTKTNSKKVSETAHTRRRLHHLAKTRTSVTRVSVTTRHRRRRYY